MAKKLKSVDQAYKLAQARFADLGVDTDAAMVKLATIPVSLHCWQGDDVGGFENTGGGLSGGIAVTGNHPGKARTPDELRADLDKALSLIRAVALAAMLPFTQGIQSAFAELPMMEQPWLGYFAVAEDRSFNFLVTSQGEISIKVVNKDGGQIEPASITLQFLATETLPDGSVRELLMKPDTLESSDPPTSKLRKTVLRSKLGDTATGQPTLEVTLEIASGAVLANARITDKGAFDKNPLRPVIRAIFTPFYAAENSLKEQWDKKQIKEFEKRIGKDSVILKHLDGKRVKLECVAATDSKSKEVNGSGSTSAEVEVSEYQKRKVDLVASPNSSLTLGNAAPGPLHNGFWFQWSADAAKDPDGKAKLAISIK